jgi:hypothetical protein
MNKAKEYFKINYLYIIFLVIALVASIVLLKVFVLDDKTSLGNDAPQITVSSTEPLSPISVHVDNIMQSEEDSLNTFIVKVFPYKTDWLGRPEGSNIAGKSSSSDSADKVDIKKTTMKSSVLLDIRHPDTCYWGTSYPYFSVLDPITNKEQTISSSLGNGNKINISDRDIPRQLDVGEGYEGETDHLKMVLYFAFFNEYPEIRIVCPYLNNEYKNGEFKDCLPQVSIAQPRDIETNLKFMDTDQITSSMVGNNTSNLYATDFVNNELYHIPDLTIVEKVPNLEIYKPKLSLETSSPSPVTTTPLIFKNDTLLNPIVTYKNYDTMTNFQIVLVILGFLIPTICGLFLETFRRMGKRKKERHL